MEVRDNEIVKALEYCLAQGITSECERCRDKIGCRDTLLRDALDLINSQKAEIEELEFELIRSRNELKGWKIRATAYKEMRSKLECKNSELEIELKAMRGAANSYKSEVERYREVVGELAVAEDGTVTGLLNGKETKFIDKEVAETFKRFAVSEARKKLVERLKERAILHCFDPMFGVRIAFSEADIDNLLAEMESERE